jgi:hypothetical protein
MDVFTTFSTTRRAGHHTILLVNARAYPSRLVLECIMNRVTPFKGRISEKNDVGRIFIADFSASNGPCDRDMDEFSDGANNSHKF